MGTSSRRGPSSRLEVGLIHKAIDPPRLHPNTDHLPEMSAHSHSAENSGHSHSNELLEANRGHFDSVAEGHGGYDSHPIVVDVTQQVAQVFHTRYTLNPESTVIMDYACGTGTPSFLQSISYLV